MFSEPKYIRTDNDQIIMFPETMKHEQFKQFNPQSAGFVKMKVDAEGIIHAECSGRSNSLDMESTPEIDTRLTNAYFFK